jgi:NifU-like protein involved in Fe-S cluster formation
MIIVLTIHDDVIEKARFSTYGCTTAEVCGQWVCDEIEGKPLESLSRLDEETIVRGVGRMPLGREHCPGLAIGALRQALNQALVGHMDWQI